MAVISLPLPLLSLYLHHHLTLTPFSFDRIELQRVLLPQRSHFSLPSVLSSPISDPPPVSTSNRCESCSSWSRYLDNVERHGEERCLDCLSQIIDPDFGTDIVSCGFVKDLEVDEALEEVSFRLELTTPACPIKDMFEEKANEVVTALPWVKK
uniref:MIP18 family-like domain-containing protein n=1 Tax=Ananas comosus var. bracteatus TaxID=296719 RepID=A0A6V7P0F6_ANACO|nr:unnamed protein product [Ananas comosus var. bracteatus]